MNTVVDGPDRSNANANADTTITTHQCGQQIQGA
jgi:hypothetical protein